MIIVLYQGLSYSEFSFFLKLMCQKLIKDEFYSLTSGLLCFNFKID